MRKIIQILGLVSLAIGMLTTGCDKKGENEWLYSESEPGNGDFSPITNIKGETGWGYAIVRWDLPASLKPLTLIDVSWTNAENVTEYKKMTHFEDSLWLALEGSDYKFRFTSCGAAGEKVTDSIQLQVPDWKAEPIENIQNLAYRVIENKIDLKWTPTNHRAYAQTTFNVYDQDENPVKSIVRKKEESTSAMISDLDYNTDYILRYYSENLAGTKTDTSEISFKTDIYAPEMPLIRILDHAGEKDSANNIITTTVYAFSTEIQWENIDPAMDSISIKFTGLNDEACDFRFKTSDKKGYLTLLPGGTVNLAINAKINGEWTGSRAQELTTPTPEDTYVFRYPNSTADKMSKIGQSFAKSSGLNNYTNGKKYTYGLMIEKCPTEFKIYMKPKMVDEIELFPTIETLIVGVDNTMPSIAPDKTGQVAPEIGEFERLVPRLVKLKVIKIRKNFGGKFSDGVAYTDKFIEAIGRVRPDVTVEVVN